MSDQLSFGISGCLWPWAVGESEHVIYRTRDTYLERNDCQRKGGYEKIISLISGSHYKITVFACFVDSLGYSIATLSFFFLFTYLETI